MVNMPQFIFYGDTSEKDSSIDQVLSVGYGRGLEPFLFCQLVVILPDVL